MTPIRPVNPARTLSPVVRRFVAHFGDMGSRWGINHTAGQSYALIFVAPAALNADDIAERLEFSRSNVSMGLKELQSWRLLNLRHLPGDRREYFDAPGDACEVFRTLAEERRRREIEPTLSMLRNALLEAPATEADRLAMQRMRGMHDLIELTTTWFDDVQRIDPQTLAKLMKMGASGSRPRSNCRTRPTRLSVAALASSRLTPRPPARPCSAETPLTSTSACRCRTKQPLRRQAARRA